MKKIISTILTAVLAVSCTTTALCAVPSSTAELRASSSTQDTVHVILDGNELSFETAPQIINNTTMVPMRVIFERLGYTVSWDGENRSISAINRNTNKYLLLMIDVPYMVSSPWDVLLNTDTSNEAEFESFKSQYVFMLETPPVIVDGNTLVPVRAISESAGCSVSWDSLTKTVGISTTVVNNTTQSTVVVYDDISDDLARINSYIYNGYYLEAIQLCDEVLSKYNLSADDTSKVNSLKADAQNKYNNYVKQQQQAEKERYYPYLHVQTFTSVTGYECIGEYPGDNAIIYRYKYSYDAVTKYMDYLYDNGWSVYKSSSEDDSFSVYYTKSFSLIGISVEFKFDEVWITMNK